MIRTPNTPLCLLKEKEAIVSSSGDLNHMVLVEKNHMLVYYSGVLDTDVRFLIDNSLIAEL